MSTDESTTGRGGREEMMVALVKGDGGTSHAKLIRFDGGIYMSHLDLPVDLG